jgi:hypothetical protein
MEMLALSDDVVLEGYGNKPSTYFANAGPTETATSPTQIRVDLPTFVIRHSTHLMTAPFLIDTTRTPA